MKWFLCFFILATMALLGLAATYFNEEYLQTPYAKELEKSFYNSRPQDLSKNMFPAPDEAGKVAVRFVGIEPRKDWATLYEVINFTSEEIYFRSPTKADFDGVFNELCNIKTSLHLPEDLYAVSQTKLSNEYSGNCLRSTRIFDIRVAPRQSIKFWVRDRFGEYTDNRRESVSFEYFDNRHQTHTASSDQTILPISEDIIWDSADRESSKRLYRQRLLEAELANLETRRNFLVKNFNDNLPSVFELNTQIAERRKLLEQMP